MTTPTPRESRVILTAETSRYVNALKNAARETESAAGRMVQALNGVESAWARVAAAARSAGATVPKAGGPAAGGAGAAEAAARREAATREASASRVAGAVEAAQRRQDKAIADSERRHLSATQALMNAQLSGEHKVHTARVTGAREEMKLIQARMAVEDAAHSKRIAQAKLETARTDVFESRVALDQASAVVKSRARVGDFGVNYRDARFAEAEAVRNLAAAQQRLRAQESAFNNASVRERTQRIRLVTAERVAAEQAARAQAAGDQAATRAAEKAAAAQERQVAAARRAATAESGRQFYAAGRDITALDDLSHAATKFGAASVAGFGIAAFAAAKWELEFAKVQRVTAKNADGTKATKEQIDALGMSLRRLATISPASLTELSEVAVTAGQLGVAREFVASFTQTAVQLGTVTNLSANQAATALAKLTSQTGESANQAQKIGSALVALGQAGASTESEILAMSIRFAGAARIAGLTTHDILALSSSMASVGIQAELGGSAMQRFLFKVYAAARLGGDALTGFSKVAGKNAQEFQRMFNEKPIEAILAVVAGLRRITDEGGNAVATLQQLGFYNVRDQRVVAALASSYFAVARNVKLAATAYEQNTALLAAYNTQAQVTANQLKIQKNRINDAAITIGNVLLPYVERAANSLANLASMFAMIPGPIRDVLTVSAALLGVFSLLGGKYLLMSANIGRLTRAVQQLTIAQRENQVAASGAAAANSVAGGAGAASAVGAVAAGAAGGGLLAKLGPKLGGLATKLKGGGGVAGIAAITAVMIGLDVANRNFGNSAAEADTKAQALAEALKYFAQNGLLAGQATAVLGPNLERLKRALAEGDSSYFKELDAGLTKLVEQGDEKSAQVVMARLTKTFAEAGVNVEQLTKLLPGYAAASSAAAIASQQEQQEIESLSQELRDYDAIIQQVQSDLFGKDRLLRNLREKWSELRDEQTKQVKSLDEVRDALTQAVGKQFDGVLAANDYAQALAGLREKITGVGNETKDSSDALDRFSDAIEKALDPAFRATDAFDAIGDKVDEIRKRVQEAGGNGILLDQSLQGDAEQNRQNRKDVEDLVRAYAEFYRLTADAKNPMPAFNARKKELADTLRQIGYAEQDVQAALAKFNQLPRSVPAAEAGAQEKLTKPVLRGTSADALANQQDVAKLVQAKAAQMAQNLRLGMSQQQVNRVIEDGKAELTGYLKALGFSARDIRTYVNRLDAIGDAYRTNTKASDDFQVSADKQAQTLEEISAIYAGLVGEFANEGLRTPDQILKEGQAQADAFAAKARQLGASADQINRFKESISDAAAQFADNAAQINKQKLKVDTSQAQQDLANMGVGVDQLRKNVKGNPVIVPFTGQDVQSSQNKKWHGWLQWAYDGISMLASWARKNPIYLVFNAIGSAIGGTAGSVIKGATAGAGVGAMLGSVIPGVGNVVGAGVGGVIGGIGGYLARADGGLVEGPGGPREDKIPAMLSAGEFVVNARSTARYLPLLRSLNGHGASPYTQFMPMASFDRPMPVGAPTQPPTVNVTGPDNSAQIAALVKAVGNRPIIVQIDGREVARVLGQSANQRARSASR